MTITRRKSRKRHCWSKWFLVIISQTCDLMLVVQTNNCFLFR